MGLLLHESTLSWKSIYLFCLKSFLFCSKFNFPFTVPNEKPLIGLLNRPPFIILYCIDLSFFFSLSSFPILSLHKTGPLLFVKIFLLNLDFLSEKISLISSIELKLYKFILYSGPGLYEAETSGRLLPLAKLDLFFTNFVNCSIKVLSSNNFLFSP